FFEEKHKKYYRCRECSAIFLDPACYLSKEAERKRYLEHNNDVEDPRYQKFVDPIVSEVKRKFGRERRGLDFGAGPGPVITKLLRNEGYSLELYDPFFWNDPGKLDAKYDFITCCEVIEHFHFPAEEFRRLQSLLVPGGALLCMTELYREEIDFKSWYYKNDPTHVFFYHPDTLERVRSLFGFSGLTIKGRLVQFAL
ncbi:MAG: class I SAM-dependent methyltransferase, partial [Candidatus Omnitrophota bacterium]